MTELLLFVAIIAAAMLAIPLLGLLFVRPSIPSDIRQLLTLPNLAPATRECLIAQQRQLLLTREHPLLAAYAAKYAAIAAYDYTPFNDLCNLLSQRGYTLPRQEVATVVRYLLDEKDCDDISSRFLLSGSSDALALVDVFLDHYRDDYATHLASLQILLCERFPAGTHTLASTKDLADHKHGARRAVAFEKSLLSSTQERLLIDTIDNMDGYSFERFCADLFRRMGYEVMHTKLSGDQGADLVVRKLGKVVVVQAKRHANKISNKAIQEVVAAMAYYMADGAMVITNSQYSDSARDLGAANNVELIDRAALQGLLGQYF